MPRRTQVFQQLPAAGGLNSSVDTGLLPSTDLQQADNIVFASNGARIKREGFDYWDSSSNAIPAVSSGASAGFVRTLTMAADITNAGVNDRLVIGESITVTSTGSDSAYTSGGPFTIVATPSTTKICYIGSSSSSAIVAGTLTVSRASALTHIKDYWRFTGSANTQQVVASTDNGLFYQYGTNGNRKQILPNLSAMSGGVTTSTRESAGTTRTLTMSGAGHGVATGEYIQVTTSAEADGAYCGTFQATVAGAAISYTAVTALTEAPTAATTITVKEYTTATPRVSSPAKTCSLVFNESLLFFQSGIGNTPIEYDKNTPPLSGDWITLATAPDASIAAISLNRVWTNDKTNPDRLHYSATGNHIKWQGADDSGAIDIRPGDGDPVGITGIYPFKGRVFVAKKNKMYQVVGDSPENFQVLDVSNGLGAEAQLAGVAVDQDDFMYVSSKGIHSLATTAAYSDFQSSYLSAKIQPTFNEFEQARLAYTQATYIQPLNSIAFMISEDDNTQADTLYFYNVQHKEWYRWPVSIRPTISPSCIATVLLSATATLFIGTENGRIIETQTGDYTDFTSTAIIYRTKTGTVYPDGAPMSLKRFIRITLFFRPVGSYTATVKVKIDNYSEQVLIFNQVNDGDLLGDTFMLGTSVLGATAHFAPYTLPIDGIGRGCTIEVDQSGTDEQIDIYGYAIEWEAADIGQETITEAQ